MMYRSLFFFDLASTKFNPALYKIIEIRGVKPELCADDKCVMCNVITDKANPQFFSAYLIDLGGHAVCVADSHFDRLDELRDVSKSFADQHHWAYQDFTAKKHDVHIYAIVRVKVPGVEALNHNDTQNCGCKRH